MEYPPACTAGAPRFGTWPSLEWSRGEPQTFDPQSVSSMYDAPSLSLDYDPASVHQFSDKDGQSSNYQPAFASSGDDGAVAQSLDYNPMQRKRSHSEGHEQSSEVSQEAPTKRPRVEAWVTQPARKLATLITSPAHAATRATISAIGRVKNAIKGVMPLTAEAQLQPTQAIESEPEGNTNTDGMLVGQATASVTKLPEVCGFCGDAFFEDSVFCGMCGKRRCEAWPLADDTA